MHRQRARHVAEQWNGNGTCAVVVGATYPDELRIVRNIIGDSVPILIPGYGAQGGDLEKSVRAGRNSSGTGFAINASRTIMYASSGDDFGPAGLAEAQRMNADINRFRM